MKDRQSFIFSATSRREFLARTGSGLGGLALTYLLDRDGHFIPSLSAAGSTNPLASKPAWKQYGESGIWVSDWYPRIAEHVDDMAVLRACWADGLNHVGSVCQM